MAGNSLGRITVDLLAKSDQFEAGLAKAAGATAQFGQEVTRSTDQWSNGFTRTDAQWENYLRLGDKPAKIASLTRGLRQLGSVVGQNVGGAFLRLAGHMENVVRIGKQFANLPAFGGAGVKGVGSWAVTRGLPIAAAAGAGVTAVNYIDEKFEDILAMFGGKESPNKNFQGLFGRIGEGMQSPDRVFGRMFKVSELGNMAAHSWQNYYDTLNAGIEVENKRGRAIARTIALLDQKSAALATAQGLERLAAADRGARANASVLDALGLGKVSDVDKLTRALSGLTAVTDEGDKWEKWAKQIADARKAIDALRGIVDEESLISAGAKVNEAETALAERKLKESGGEIAAGEFRAVDSLARIARGGVAAAGDRATSLLGEINAGIKQLNRNALKPALVGG